MKNRRPVRTALLASAAMMPFALVAALANPLGPNVVGGTATVTGTGTANVTVNQTTQNAIINWRTFNIGVGEQTRFIQPNATAMTLNRVTGAMGPTSIYGNITANGRIFIVNPDGILIGRGATINTAGFLATTHDISNADFMANRLNFNISGRPDASVVNEGLITATNAGFAALVAPGVRNSGTITARFGRIGLAAANGFSLDLYGDQLITLNVNDTIAHQVRDVATGLPLSALVKNDGVLKANGGRVELTAAAARTVVDSVINTSGVIEARTIGRRDGKIVLGAATAATKPAGLPQQTVKVSGKLSVASKKNKAGTIQITGENIEVTNATLDATGYLGGGIVLIGGDIGGGHVAAAVAAIPQARLQAGPVPRATTVTIDGSTVINASATGVGNAGKVVVWADGSTTFAGTILARGGPLGGSVVAGSYDNISGNTVATGGIGGFVEVSGKQSLTFSGLVDLSAPNGKSGTLLLDPLNGFVASVAGPGVILASSIATALAFADVIVTTNNLTGTEAGDLFVNAPITWSSEHSLWLTAFRNVVINANITNNYVAPGPVGDFKHNINIIADNTGTGVGTVMFGPGAMIATRGEVNIAFNPSVNPANSPINPNSYVNPVENFLANFDPLGVGTLKQYMKVNTPADLQNVTNNLNDNYVLGRDIDMTGVVRDTYSMTKCR